MSSTVQLSLDEDREKQMERVIANRPELQGLGMTGAVKKLFFDTCDSIAPMDGEKK